MVLTGKNFVFVGGLGGIGYETSEILMTKNLAYLVILDAIENASAVKRLQALNPKTKVIYIKFDITNKADVKRAVAEAVGCVKYIDVLLNGAGVLNDRNIDLTIGVNLTGLIYTTFEALPYINKNQYGRGGIVANVASVYGLEPYGPISVYVASKFGVMGFTRSLADQFYYDLTGVSFITLCPGLTVTPMTKSIVGRDSFDYAKPISQKFDKAVMQSARVCAENLIRAIETNKNGGIFIANEDILEEVTPKKFWDIKFTN